MRIGVNARFLLKDKLEGIGWYTYHTVKRMVLAHPEDEFIFFFDRSFSKEFIFADNVKGVVVSPPARHPLLWTLWFELGIPRALKKHKVDIFFSPDGYCSLKTQVPTLMVMHDLAYVHYPEQIPKAGRKFYQKYVPKYLQKAEHIIAVSEATKADIMRQCEIPESNISVAYNGCREEFKKEADSKKEILNGQAYFYFIGAIHPRKNVSRIIQAFHSFKKKTGQPHQLVLAGRMAWQTDEIEQLLNDSIYKDQIHLPGYLNTQDAVQYMRSAFAFVYPSLFEGFGVPVLEALNADVPVISSNVSSLPEVAGDAGLLVDPNSVEEIADAMQKLVENESLRSELIKNGKQQREKFSWDESSKIIYERLQFLLS